MTDIDRQIRDRFIAATRLFGRANHIRVMVQHAGTNDQRVVFTGTDIPRTAVWLPVDGRVHEHDVYDLVRTLCYLTTELRRAK